MSEPILQVDGMTKMFGGFVALDNVSLHLDQGERLVANSSINLCIR